MRMINRFSFFQTFTNMRAEFFRVEQWLSSENTYKQLVSEGFHIMDDMNLQEITKLLKQVFRDNNVSLVKQIISNGLDLKIWPPENDTGYFSVLSVALDCVSDDEIGLIQCLVDAGSDIDGPGNTGSSYNDTIDIFGLPAQTPLAHAVRRKLPKIAKYLLEKGSKVEDAVLVEVGKTLDIDMLSTIHAQSQKDNCFEVSYDLILYSALGAPYSGGANMDKFKADKLSMVEMLIEYGVDPNVIPSEREDGQSSGHKCVSGYVDEEHDCKLLRLFIRHGLKMDITDRKGQTLLHYATKKGQKEIVRFLISEGADVNAKDMMGKTPLFMPLDYHQDSPMELIKIFLENSADFSLATNQGVTFMEKLFGMYEQYQAYEKELCFVLKSVEVQLPDAFGVLHFDFCGWTVLSCLLQAGCKHYQLLEAALDKTVTDGNLKGLQLVTHASPNHIHRTAVHLENVYTGDENPVFVQAFNTCKKSVASLKMWCAFHLRCQLVAATGGRSILPRLPQVVTPSQIPPELAPIITLECFTVNNDVEARPNEEFLNQQLMPALPYMLLNQMIMGYDPDESDSEEDMFIDDEDGAEVDDEDDFLW